MGHLPSCLCFSAYFLRVLLNLSSAFPFLHAVLLTCSTLRAKIWATGSRSFLIGVMVEKNLLALWLLFLLLKTSITAAASLAVFCGVACAASTPYRAPEYTLDRMTLAFASALAELGCRLQEFSLGLLSFSEFADSLLRINGCNLLSLFASTVTYLQGSVPHTS